MTGKLLIFFILCHLFSLFTLFSVSHPILNTFFDYICRGSCGIYCLRYLEVLCFGGDIMDVDEAHLPAMREKLAIDIFMSNLNRDEEPKDDVDESIYE